MADIEIKLGSAPAPTVTHFALVGTGNAVRLVFLTSPTPETAPQAFAVILNRRQLSGLAEMISDVLDTDDPHAIGLN